VVTVPARQLRVATRGSALARWQADHVAALLGGEQVEMVVVETTGDRRTDIPIHQMGGQGVFVKEVQAAVLDGRADVAVHSAKDLPSLPTAGLVIAAVPARDDPRDALVGATLAELRPGARVATGSVRRRAQLASLLPDLTFQGLRGNMETRLRAAGGGGVTAVVVAYAALRRLGLAHQVAQVLPPSLMLPQVAQGALAIECRDDDDFTRERLAAIEDPAARWAVDAERAFLAHLGSGCDLPVGAYAVDGRLTGLIATLDGRVVLRHSLAAEGVAADRDPAALGAAVAEHLLVRAGGAALMADLRGTAVAVPNQPAVPAVPDVPDVPGSAGR
jgi:hydroxymethylbilane synthase